ncbi:hypothetical protein ACIREM_28105 [Streptomyces shenzhenensis]|uniref:hypothetical protein n=1 Tax=Streptomyces shenzhenensis TaxID=943815 RepID=UPI0037F71023
MSQRQGASPARFVVPHLLDSPPALPRHRYALGTAGVPGEPDDDLLFWSLPYSPTQPRQARRAVAPSAHSPTTAGPPAPN